MIRASKLKKGITIFIHLASVITFAICSVMLFYETKYSGYSFTYMLDDSNKSQKFEDTIEFEALMQTYISNVLKYVVIRNQFETNGKFDPNKEIDIAQYALHKENSNQQKSSVTYRLEDLIILGKNGVYQQPITADDYDKLVYAAKVDLAESQNNIDTETTEEIILYNYLLEPDYSNLDNSYKNSLIDDYSKGENIGNETYYPAVFISKEDETILPTDGLSLILHTASVQQYSEYSTYLLDAVSMAKINYDFYEDMKPYFENGNFKYYVSFTLNKEDYIYSNLVSETETRVSNIRQAFTNNGRYFELEYDYLDSNPVTNMNIDSDMVLDEIELYAYTYKPYTKMWFGIDVNYANEDEFSNVKASYLKTFTKFKNVLVICTLMLLPILLTILFLTLLEKPNKERSSKLDCIRTELAFVLSVGGIVLMIAGIFFGIILLVERVPYRTLISSSLYAVLIFISLGFSVLILDGYFLIFYLSFVRRYKRSTLWSNSLLKLFTEGIHKVVNHPIAAVRTWIPYILFLAINMIMVLAAIYINTIIFLLLLLITDGVIGVMIFKSNFDRLRIINHVKQITEGNLDIKLQTDKLYGDNKLLADAVNTIGNGIKDAVSASTKDERMKTDLITNVSHDIKTPLTSIISYIDLIKRENVDNPNIKEYVRILDLKSQRLKQLTDDLVEASKISSGNIVLQMERLDFKQMMLQSVAEFEEKFSERGLEPVWDMPSKPVYILADSRCMWRVIENILSNIVKYAMQNTRVYFDMVLTDSGNVLLTVKNISSQKLNIDAKELTERFIRGDVARSTEGSGLGLSIASSLTNIQNGKFDIYLDGDLFKINIEFSRLTN